MVVFEEADTMATAIGDDMLVHHDVCLLECRASVCRGPWMLISNVSARCVYKNPINCTFTRAILSKNIEKRSSDARRARCTRCDHLSCKRIGVDPQNQQPAGLCASDPHEPRVHVKEHRVAVILSPLARKTEAYSTRGTHLTCVGSLFYPLARFFSLTWS